MIEFEFYKLKDGTGYRFDFLVHNNIQDVFVKLCNRNNYDELISLVADMNKTDFKLGDLKVQLVQFSTTMDSKEISIFYRKDNQNLK